MSRMILLLASLLLVLACDDATGPSRRESPSEATSRVPAELRSMLYGSSSLSSVNPASLFTIDEITGAAALVGPANIPEGSDRISAIDLDPTSGELYGIKGGACHGAILITLDPGTGTGTIVDTLRGGWFDGTPGANCPGGADALAFAPDGTLYVGAWYGGIPQGKIMRVDKATAAVLAIYSTPLGYDDWKGRRAHISGMAIDADGTVWISRGSSAVPGQINTIDPTTGNILSTLYLQTAGGQPEDSITISDLAFAPDGKLYASLPWENMLATIDTSTGVVNRIGSFGAAVDRISGLTALPGTMQKLLGRYWFNEATSGQGPTTVFDDQVNPVNLNISYVSALGWTLQGGHRGIRSSAFSHRGLVSGNARGTKYETALDAASQATFVTVASWVQPPYSAAVAGFQTRGIFQRRVAMLLTNSSGQPFVVFRTQQQTAITVLWPINLGDDVRRVLHIVYDSDDPIANRRIRLYIDGVDQGPGQLTGGNWPSAGEGLDFNENGLDLQLVNQFFLFWAFPMQGTIFYYAVYETALSDSEIAGNAASLTADDDNLP